CVDRSVEPLLLTVYFDLFLVDGDPPTAEPSRVFLGFRKRVRPVPDRAVGTVNAEPLEHRDDLPQRQPHRMESHPEHPDGCRGALILPNLITVYAQRLSEQVTEFHGQCSLRPAHFSSHLN